jgi:hypothetical protein
MCLKLTSRVYGLSDNVSNSRGSEKCATPWGKNTATMDVIGQVHTSAALLPTKEPRVSDDGKEGSRLSLSADLDEVKRKSVHLPGIDHRYPHNVHFTD